MIGLLAGPWGPALIFLLRIVDVSLGTTRMLLVVRGARVAAPLIGFVEILVWLTAAGAAVQNLDSPLHVLAYAGGFAAGTAVGVWLEQQLALGISTVQAMSRGGSEAVAGRLRSEGWGVTELSGRGRQGRVAIVSTIVRRREVPDVIEAMEEEDPDAFITVYDDTQVRRGWLPGVRGK